ncbi:MAG: RNA-binding protein [Firmicutes bacterium]|nr:RNA-binding protein [Bacillota bacterium]
MKEDAFFLGQLADKIDQCENKYITTYTSFMDGHQQSIARIHCRKNFIPVADEDRYGPGDMGSIPATRSIFYGGYPDAERVILINLPDYAFLENENPLTVIRATKAEGSRELTHRDYLGSLVGLGIKRELLGDILVREDGADIICMSDIAEFILMNYCKAGRTNLSLEQRDIKDLIVPARKTQMITDTVASLRLDSVAASAFGLSRGKASEAITRGIVFVNHMEVTKPDYQLSEGDRITLRGKGKAVLSEIGGKSRKDRQYIKIERY